MHIAKPCADMSDRSLKGKVVVVSGASRGIGHEIAVCAGADGARVALLAKTDTANPKITSTLPQTVESVRTAGGQALAGTQLGRRVRHHQPLCATPRACGRDGRRPLGRADRQ